MKYCIISIDDSRLEFKRAIREHMGDDEVSIKCLDARPREVDIDAELNALGTFVNSNWMHMPPKRGDFGGFVGHMNSWLKCIELDEPLVVFEDDAIMGDYGVERFVAEVEAVDPGWEFISLCVNNYGKMFYNHLVRFDEWGYHKYHHPSDDNQFHVQGHVSRVYQPWTLTAAVYTPASAQHLISRVREVGAYMNADAYVMHEARLGKFNAYAPTPDIADEIVAFNEGHSIIQSNGE